MRNGWEVKELAAVSAINYGYTESASSEPVGPRFLRITDIQDDQVNWDSVPYCKIEPRDESKYRLATGDIVFARTGATTGKSFLVNEPPHSVFASYLIRLRLQDKKLLPEFLALFFQTDRYWQSIKDGSSGSAQGGFNATKLSALSVPIPPLAEQKRIVGIVREAFESIAKAKAKAEKNVQNARALFASHLQSVFTQREEGWMEKQLSDVCVLVNGRAYKRDEMLGAGKYPLLRVGNFFTNKGWFYSDLELESDKYCDKGDLLYAWSASFGPRIWEGGKVIYHYHIWKVLPKSEIVDKRFLLHLLEWDVEQIKQAHGTGTTMMHVSKGSMESRLVPIPPLKEQARIILLLDNLTKETQRLEDIYQRKLTALDALKKSLLHQAFSGDL
jgi:type I restriction enzyme S subunit